ncbi:GTP-binding protein Sey1 [Pseudohyphozyma bogoriensis]|nr:GTP-binding protein Sey1 [Pseudohyphozyma bogoriensis]
MNQSIDIAEKALSDPSTLPTTVESDALQAIADAKAAIGAEAGGSDGVEGVIQGGMDAKLQVVDENQEFTKALDAHMKNWKLRDAGFSYDVVAVFGSQSTGKSTLLNRLFGTKFDVMSETERRQTTKGIWMSKGQDMSVLVMDVEGTDGRERGEDQDFERKSALFSIAVAEVLIVNIWEHQVGLYQGANMGLLKTVFEVNLGLFLAAKEKGKAAGTVQDKTLLLFVIRDHFGATPLQNLQNTLTADLNRLWDGLSKPPGLEDSQITTFFDLGFVTLPHKLLQPELFEKEVLQLRKRFTDPKEEGYVFLPKYHKRIPADGISQYMSTIWDAVVTNKDLDLPTQQELLAQFRCDEIASAAFVSFTEATKAFGSPTGQGKLVKGLGEAMQNARSAALATFDAAASRYHSGVYTRKRAELLAKLNSTLSPFFLSHLKNLHKLVLKDFRKAIQDGLKVDGYDFAEVVKATRKTAEEEFVKGAKEVKLDETEWSYEESLEQLREDVVAIADLLRVEETKKMVAVIERNIKKHVSETVELSLNKPSPTMWDKILSTFKDALETAETAYVKKATSFNCTEEENAEALIHLRKRAWLALRAKIDEQTAEAVMLVKLKLIFEDRFRYDEEGIPRVWKPDDDIDAIFKKAKDAVLALIPLYATISPSDSANNFTLPSSSDPNDLENPEFDFPSTLILLSETKADDLASRFRREADAYYLEAKRSMVSSISQIPYWIYGVLVVLGWNEFVAVIRSPIYFTLLLIAAAAAYITIQLNMTGPVLTIARTVSREVVKSANELLHTYFQGQTAEAHVARNTTAPVRAEKKKPVGEDIEMEEKTPLDEKKSQ